MTNQSIEIFSIFFQKDFAKFTKYSDKKLIKMTN